MVLRKMSLKLKLLAALGTVVLMMLVVMILVTVWVWCWQIAINGIKTIPGGYRLLEWKDERFRQRYLRKRRKEIRGTDVSRSQSGINPWDLLAYPYRAIVGVKAITGLGRKSKKWF